MTDWGRVRVVAAKIKRCRVLAAGYRQDGNTRDADALDFIADEVVRRREASADAQRRNQNFRDDVAAAFERLNGVFEFLVLAGDRSETFKRDVMLAFARFKQDFFKAKTRRYGGSTKRTSVLDEQETEQQRDDVE